MNMHSMTWQQHSNDHQMEAYLSFSLIFISLTLSHILCPSFSAAEQAKREASERENRAMEEQLVVQERLRADQQRTYEENVNQLMERMERDSRNAIAEHDRVLQARLKVGIKKTQTLRSTL